MNQVDNAKELQKALILEPENATAKVSEETLSRAYNLADEYKMFLNRAKTEREAVTVVAQMVEKAGFIPFEKGKRYVPGDKVYLINRGKAMILAVIGRESLRDGVFLCASHIDSPRIDLKPRPLYEEAQLALFKTHYYGGIKKYQWTALPLALHGVIIKKDGTVLNICIGEDAGDELFCICDLLPHVGKLQMARTLEDGIRGEELNVLVGSNMFPCDEKIKERVKLNTMRILHERFGITESDFLSAELSLVPAHFARDVGFDRSMVGGYGQDDRVCAFASLAATLEVNHPVKTVITVLADKEEVGSDGNTGLNSAYLKYFIADLASPYGIEGRDVLSATKCLSADVNLAFDPTFPDVSEKNNTAYLNYGVVITKYTGSRGKVDTSEASAEFMAEIRSLLDNNAIIWQTGELGKVDMGGGGTVAKYIAALNADVVDLGVPVLSMHSPFEVVSKLDLYMAKQAFSAFMNQQTMGAV